MKKMLENVLWEFINKYCQQNAIRNVWQCPVMKFASAANPLFAELKTLIVHNHYLPSDYLPNANTVISYFLPFVRRVGQSNLGERPCSALWAEAYIHANAMAVELNGHLVDTLRAQRVEACIPSDVGMISNELPKSRWSQRHVAYIAGHGTFGLNNMLISDEGSVGRYYSLITSLEVPADRLVHDERCLYKKSGTCKLCVQRCFAGALTENGFDRGKCLEQCMKNDALYRGADVCGKCVVELPCSHKKFAPR